MRHFLTFTLAAPLASFGTVAVGGRRTGVARPGKSQVLGLVAAALGIPRTDEGELAALAEALGYAVRVETSGIAETDYHTTQVPPTTRRRRYSTRAEELAVPKHELDTELSWREFRSGFCATACLWSAGGSGVSLDRIADHLTQPTFALCLGRKAFPLMLPCQPMVAEAISVADAFRLRDARDHSRLAAFAARFGTDWREARHGRGPAAAVVYADAIAEPPLGLPIARRQQSRDIPDSRAKWRFRLRAEVVADWRDQS